MGMHQGKTDNSGKSALFMYFRLSASNLNSRLESEISPAGVVSSIVLNSEDMPFCHLIKLPSILS